VKERIILSIFTAVVLIGVSGQASEVDQILTEENQAAKVTLKPMPVVDDLTFLRRVYIDLIGRIPSGEEIAEFQQWPANGRREKLIDKLIEHERFADRWTTFFADMLRLRSNATGGAALLAYVHKAVKEDMPYDELCRRLISANGKANSTPEVGFVLGDDADPLQMAAVTSQVFMGVRMSCAQCHDHPFDVWTRKDFYGLAAYYGKTRRVESRLTRVVYTTEGAQTSVLWPPEDYGEVEEREPMKPVFPIDLIDSEQTPEFVARLIRRRAEEEKARLAKAKATAESTVDDLLNLTAAKANKQTSGSLLDELDVASEAKNDIRKIDVKADLYRQSQLRTELADLVTSPRNRFFSRSIVNRLWKELVGRGFVEPVDDFRSDNEPSHPETMDFVAEEFVASGYNFRHLVRMIVSSEAYARANAPADADFGTRQELEAAFLATPMRRMYAEALYDSIVTAGHLFEVKHPAGVNKKVVYQTVRVPVKVAGEDGEKPAAESDLTPIASNTPAAMSAPMQMASGGYALEQAIELDFDKLLTANEDDVKVDEMKVMSAEELEAMRMMRENRRPQPGMKYVTKQVERVYDDNPSFNSSYRMASPAPAGHFLRVFGQPGRQDLGDLRVDDPSMRQALMMLNGRMTHEASRVGSLEPLYSQLTGPKADLDQAIKTAYLEIMTRVPSEEEIAEAKAIIGDKPLEGMADLRWALLNCNEFRFIP